MRRYTSKVRIALYIAMIVGGIFLASGGNFSFAQAAGSSEPVKAKPEGLMTLILGHIDFVFIIIMLLSVTGLSLIIQGFLKTRATVFMPEETTNQIREMISARKFKELIEFTETDPSFISRSINPALKRAPSFSSMKEAMETAIGEQTTEQFRRIEYLNIIGNLGPLLGLVGTVLGMIQAFSAMKAAGGSANPADLAGGISTALCHTFLGLFLAVPCLGAFGVLRTMTDRLTVRGALVSEELLLMIKPAEAKPAATAAIHPKPGIPAPRKIPAPAPTPA